MSSLDVPRIDTTYEQFEERASELSGVKIRKKFRPRRGAELRPLLGEVYEQAFAGYDWWGYIDWDTCWGDWDSFLTDGLLSQYDMIAGCDYVVNGPFNVFRNTPAIAGLWRRRIDMVIDPQHRKFDEFGFDAVCRDEARAGRMRLLYPADIQAHDRMEKWNRCTLRGAKLYRMDREGNIGPEILYFHFPGTKRWPL